MSTMTSREFNQQTSLAQKLALSNPVIITNRGKPAFVLIKYEDYQKQKPAKSALDLLMELDHPDVSDIELEIQPRSKAKRTAADFGEL